MDIEAIIELSRQLTTVDHFWTSQGQVGKTASNTANVYKSY